jgi:ligand-binding sensor domain-containing protein/two-component sensor histidine kinase
LSGSAIYALEEDRDSNLWIGTKESGVMRLPRGGLTMYTEREGYRSGAFSSSIFETRSGELCVTAGHERIVYLNVFDGARFSAVPVTAPLGPALWETVMLQGRGGEWWVTTGRGLFRLPPVMRARDLSRARPETEFTVRRGLLGNDVHPLYQDSRGDLWFACSRAHIHELYRWERATGNVRPVSTADTPSLKTKQVTAIAESLSGELWIGFKEGGLVRWSSGVFTDFPHPVAGFVQALHFDAAGRLWIGSLGSGLIRIDHPASHQPRTRSYTSAGGLSSNHVWCVTHDRFGRIYLGTSAGVDRLDPDTGSIKSYTTSEGLPKGAVTASFCDRSGALWFATHSGISRLVPAPDPGSPPPGIFIRALRVMAAPYPISELGQSRIAGLRLPASRNGVEVEFFSPDFTPGGRRCYQYRLDSVDHDWSPPDNQRTVNFASLAPGSYRFLVRAVNPDGAASPQPAMLEFTVLKPLWMEWWFLAIIGLVAGVLIYGGYRYRLAHLIRLERVRTRIACDLHDDIGSSLSQIAILSELARRDAGETNTRVAEPLQRIASVSREILDSLGDIVWSINPAHDRLADLIQRMRRFGGEVLESRDIQWKFRSPDMNTELPLDAGMRREIFLIFKESVHNLVRHSGCSAAETNLEIKAGCLVLTMRDNGRGFDPRQACGGNGLRSMRSRAARLGGTLEFVSNGRGGAVVLRIPLPRTPLRKYVGPRRSI